MRLVIELADAGILALPDEGELSPPSPGIAIVEGDQITVGRAAAARARLAPRLLHRRFWQDISTDPLGRPFGRRLRSADLAWTHLSDLWREAGRGVTSVILAVPGGRPVAQLGLILGVARAAGLPVHGLVDSAVAALAGREIDHPVLHLDFDLHRAILTVVAPGPIRRAVSVSTGVGLAVFEDAWLRFIARRFLKETRFDPFHSAASEQDLFDRLPTILSQLGRRDSTNVTLTVNGKLFTVEIDRKQLESAVAGPIGELDELVSSASTEQPGGLLLSARAASVPGLADRMARVTGLEVRVLGLAAAAAGALKLGHRIAAPGEVLPLVVDLGTPGAGSPPAGPAR